MFVKEQPYWNLEPSVKTGVQVVFVKKKISRKKDCKI